MERSFAIGVNWVVDECRSGNFTNRPR